MKKIFLFGLLVLLFSCVSKRKYVAKENEVFLIQNQLLAKEQEANELKKQLDSIYYNTYLDSDKDGISDNFDKCPTIPGSIYNEGCPEVAAAPTVQVPQYLEYFQRLKPTATLKLTSFIPKNTSLLNCNTKIIKTIQNKLQLEDGEYKYFYMSDGNYGIVTNKQCITESGKLIKTQQNLINNSCRWYELTCVEKGYFKFYIIFITKKGIDGDMAISESKLMTYYNDDALDTNWRAIPELKELLEDPKNVYNDDYSVIVKFFKIKKTGLAPAELVSNSTSDYKTALKSLFKN